MIGDMHLECSLVKLEKLLCREPGNWLALQDRTNMGVGDQHQLIMS
jgi:hypothetical protein